MSISINGKDLSPYIGAENNGECLDGTYIRQTINEKRPINEDFITFKETYNWNGDVIDITSWIIRDADEARLSNIVSHFQIDLSEIREFLDMKRQQKRKPLTNADRVRAMTGEELANFIVYRDCCPGFFTGTFSDANRKKYGFDGRSERCEFGGEECIACWLDWLKQECTNV